MSLENVYDNLKRTYEGPAEVLQHYEFDIENDDSDLNRTLSAVVEDNGYDLGASVGSAFLLGFAAARDPELGKEPENAGAAPLPEGAELPEAETDEHDAEDEQPDTERDDTPPVPYEQGVPSEDEGNESSPPEAGDEPDPAEPVGEPVEEDVANDDE